MTTEDDFQSALDKNPDDWQTRLVFADWLQDRDDPRAEGYRALGTFRMCPMCYRDYNEWTWWRSQSGHPPDMNPVWWKRLVDFKYHRGSDKSYRTRRQAEDAAARAFAQLTADQIALISGYQP